jgi:hypothetical protein
MSNTGSQAAETDGFYANLTIAKPKLEKGDYHTLAELSLQSADTTQIVEVGWNVDRAVNGVRLPLGQQQEELLQRLRLRAAQHQHQAG